jgi:SAM-dependent methyltransferase
VAAGPLISSPEDLREIRRSRRHPARTQYDYLHIRTLVAGLREALAAVPGPVEDVLDVWCGSRPYEDLLPAGARCTGLDVEGNPYGVADVVSNELLPFADDSFDLVMCVQAFHYMPDPEHAVAEFSRVLRPGGTVLVASVFGFDYDRCHFEARYTEQQLRALFESWDAVNVKENGGRGVTWTVLTGSLLYGLEQRMTRRPPLRVVHPVFLASYAFLNTLGTVLEWAQGSGSGDRRAALPMNLTLTARKPARA